MSFETIQQIAYHTAQVQIVSLEARLEEFSGYVYNRDLILECKALKEQIKALKKYQNSVLK